MEDLIVTEHELVLKTKYYGTPNKIGSSFSTIHAQERILIECGEVIYKDWQLMELVDSKQKNMPVSRILDDLHAYTDRGKRLSGRFEEANGSHDSRKDGRDFFSRAKLFWLKLLFKVFKL